MEDMDQNNRTTRLHATRSLSSGGSHHVYMGDVGVFNRLKLQQQRVKIPRTVLYLCRPRGTES